MKSILMMAEIPNNHLSFFLRNPFCKMRFKLPISTGAGFIFQDDFSFSPRWDMIVSMIFVFPPGGILIVSWRVTDHGPYLTNRFFGSKDVAQPHCWWRRRHETQAWGARPTTFAKRPWLRLVWKCMDFQDETLKPWIKHTGTHFYGIL